MHVWLLRYSGGIADGRLDSLHLVERTARAAAGIDIARRRG
jgi:hypothetical protein